jgi:hypothetical protein
MNINSRLMQANIRTYLDVLDPESQTTDDITGVITRNISECTHLLAVVSETAVLVGAVRNWRGDHYQPAHLLVQDRTDRIAAVPR